MKVLLIVSTLTVLAMTGCSTLQEIASKIKVKQQPKTSATKTDVHQIWQGEYICAQGKTNIRVDVNTHNHTASMRFWNKKSHTKRSEQFDGIIYGKVNMNDGLWFYPNSKSIDEWNVRPSGNIVFNSIRWRTRYVNNFKLDGTVEGRGCSSIELARIN